MRSDDRHAMETWSGHALELFGARIQDYQGLIRSSVANTLNSVLDDEDDQLFKVTCRRAAQPGSHKRKRPFSLAHKRFRRHSGLQVPCVHLLSDIPMDYAMADRVGSAYSGPR